MATLNELMADVGLGTVPQQTKQASATKSVNEEISKVLENLGLGTDGETIKTASEETNNEENGGPMGLQGIYENLFGDVAPAAEAVEPQEKIASEVETEVSASEGFGELAAAYFGVAKEAFVEKIAGDLEAEAGAGHDPMGAMPSGGQLTNIIGAPKQAKLPVNAPQGEAHHVTTGNQSPYSLKVLAQVKQILKRNMKHQDGETGAYNE